jgi:hypothetical protein
MRESIRRKKGTSLSIPHSNTMLWLLDLLLDVNDVANVATRVPLYTVLLLAYRIDESHDAAC